MGAERADELHDKDAVETAIPVVMTTPMSDMTLSVVPVAMRNRITPESPEESPADDEGIGERSELRHQDDKPDDREDETDAETLERLRMSESLPPIDTVIWEEWCMPSRTCLICPAHAAEISSWA